MPRAWLRANSPMSFSTTQSCFGVLASELRYEISTLCTRRHMSVDCRCRQQKTVTAIPDEFEFLVLEAVDVIAPEGIVGVGRGPVKPSRQDLLRVLLERAVTTIKYPHAISQREPIRTITRDSEGRRT